MSGSYAQESQLVVWELSEGKAFDPIDWNDGLPSPGKCMVTSAQFLKTTGELILAGGAGYNEAKLFHSTFKCTPVCSIRGLSRPCFTVDFSNQGDMFAIGGKDGVVRVFNLHNEG